MKRIASFSVDHNNLKPGVYLSRADGDIITYDLRFISPNTPPYLDNGVMHTIEHLFATHVRNSEFKDNIVYFGPMGCRTGFYFLTRGISHSNALALIKKALMYISEYDRDIPGVSAAECGNYLEHNLQGARKHASAMCHILAHWSESLLEYNS